MHLVMNCAYMLRLRCGGAACASQRLCSDSSWPRYWPATCRYPDDRRAVLAGHYM